MYETFIDSRIIRKSISTKKGCGLFATENIPKNTVIIKEKPAFFLENKQKKIYSEMFELLYLVFTNDTSLSIKKFKKLTPSILDRKFIQNHKNRIMDELDKLENNEKTRNIYIYFKQNFCDKEILLYCAKYICNAFEFNKLPSILFSGTLLNHSCLPNVLFGYKDEIMYFITFRDIKENEEILDNYCNINLEKEIRQENLAFQYNFKCDCIRCSEKDRRKLKEFDTIAKEIEQKRAEIFKYKKY